MSADGHDGRCVRPVAAATSHREQIYCVDVVGLQKMATFDAMELERVEWEGVRS